MLALILMEFMKDVLELEENGGLTINTIEKRMGILISTLIKLCCTMAGSLLSNIVPTNVDTHCSCGKKLISTKHNAKTKILSMFGYIPITRDTLFCRKCRKGYGVIDKQLEIYNKHRITKGLTEIITYLSQLMPFEEASQTLKKLIGIEVSPTQMHIISEEIGKQVFEKDSLEANKAYNKPEEAAPQELSLYRKEGRLYIIVDGSQVNTRFKDNNGSSWKEMKLGLIFNDKDTIRTSSDNCIIIKKQYVPYFGSSGEFKKFVFLTAAKAGYGKIKEVVVMGDGAQWIWNMCEELFPDAVQILDFYHFSENVHNYSKVLYTENEVARKGFVNKAIGFTLEGEIDKVVKFVEEKKLSKLPDGTVNLPVYILNNRERINYSDLKKDGYYIGSGAIESGNKVVIQKRMKQSGMRWSIEGGQYIAALRGKYKSGNWDEVVDIINVS
jgi:hypothetical protein